MESKFSRQLSWGCSVRCGADSSSPPACVVWWMAGAVLGHAGPSCPHAAAVCRAEPKEEFDANESSLQKAGRAAGAAPLYECTGVALWRRPMYFLLHCLPSAIPPPLLQGTQLSLIPFLSPYFIARQRMGMSSVTDVTLPPCVLPSLPRAALQLPMGCSCPPPPGTASSVSPPAPWGNHCLCQSTAAPGPHCEPHLSQGLGCLVCWSHT